jgi:hypothetical protein
MGHCMSVGWVVIGGRRAQASMQPLRESASVLAGEVWRYGGMQLEYA